MDYHLFQKLRTIAPNQYEAVILTAKTARKLNGVRKKEEGAEAAEGALPSHRVTRAALEEITSGRVEISRP
jgi:DNA-directed RNA polymerase omega subunit